MMTLSALLGHEKYLALYPSPRAEIEREYAEIGAKYAPFLCVKPVLTAEEELRVNYYISMEIKEKDIAYNQIIQPIIFRSLGSYHGGYAREFWASI